MERLADAGAVCSVGSRGDSYDNALAEAVNALYKAAVIRKPPLAVSRAKALSLHKTQGDSTPREGASRQADCVLTPASLWWQPVPESDAGTTELGALHQEVRPRVGTIRCPIPLPSLPAARRSRVAHQGTGRRTDRRARGDGGRLWPDRHAHRRSQGALGLGSPSPETAWGQR